MRVYHDIIFASRIQFNVPWSGSGSGPGRMIRIQRETLNHYIAFSSITNVQFYSLDNRTKGGGVTPCIVLKLYATLFY